MGNCEKNETQARQESNVEPLSRKELYRIMEATGIRPDITRRIEEIARRGFAPDPVTRADLLREIFPDDRLSYRSQVWEESLDDIKDAYLETYPQNVRTIKMTYSGWFVELCRDSLPESFRMEHRYLYDDLRQVAVALAAMVYKHRHPEADIEHFLDPDD